MSRYALLDGVYYVSGAKQAALYDTISGNVYSLNEAAKKALLGQVDDEEFWQRLLEIGVAIVPTASGDEPLFGEIPSQDIHLEFIWFEVVSQDCNQQCVHCYANSLPPILRQGSARAEFAATSRRCRKLTYQQWTALVEEGFALGCRACQFIGGEPFLYRGESGETVLDLAARAKAIGYESVELFTNATLLTADKVNRLQALDLKVGVTLFSNDPAIHDAITRTPGSHRKTMKALEMLKRAEVPTRVGTVVMRANQEAIHSTQQWIQDMGFENNGIDVLRPSGRGLDPTLTPDDHIVAEYALITAPNFSADKQTVVHNHRGNSCLAGRIAVTDTGDVLPCIFSRTETVGNVVEAGGLADIIYSGALQTVWYSTKDSVMVCKDCEYRYVCSDCRPIAATLAEGKAGYLTAPYPRCTYNPHTGEWGGTWHWTADGDLRYSGD